MATNLYSEESDLWIFAPPEHSAWAARMDWYLNWQMCKGLAHTRMSGEELPEVATFITKDAPILIASKDRLPAKSCLVLPLLKGEKTWLKKVHAIAHGLGAKKIQVFLSPGMKSEMAKEYWREWEPKIHAVFSNDEEAKHERSN